MAVERVAYAGPRFEYRIEEYSSRGRAPDLAALGSDGWELVSACPSNLTGDLALFFKRLVP